MDSPLLMGGSSTRGTPQFRRMVSDTAAEDPLPAPAVQQGPIMAAAHVAATLAGGLEKEQKKLAAKTLKRASAYDSASTQIEQTCAKVTKLTEGLQELQENLDKMRNNPS